MVQICPRPYILYFSSPGQFGFPVKVPQSRSGHAILLIFMDRRSKNREVHLTGQVVSPRTPFPHVYPTASGWDI